MKKRSLKEKLMRPIYFVIGMGVLAWAQYESYRDDRKYS